jgi:hypothetical protein
MSDGCDYCNHPCREVVYEVNLCEKHVEQNDIDENPDSEHIDSFIDCLKLCMTFPNLNESVSATNLCGAMDLDEYDIGEMFDIFVKMGFIYNPITKLLSFPKNENCPFWSHILPESIKSISIEFYSKERFTTKTLNESSQSVFSLYNKIQTHQPSDSSRVIDCAIVDGVLELYIGSE